MGKDKPGTLKNAIATSYTNKIISFMASCSQTPIDQRPNKILFREFQLAQLVDLSKELSEGNEENAEKILAFFHYKLGVGESKENYINNGSGSAHNDNGIRLNKLLNKLYEGTFLDQESKENKCYETLDSLLQHEIKLDEPTPHFTSDETQNIDLAPTENDLSTNCLEATVPVDPESAQSTTKNLAQPATNTSNTPKLSSPPEESHSDHASDGDSKTKKWPLPIRIFLGIFKGIGSFFGTIFGWIKNLFV